MADQQDKTKNKLHSTVTDHSSCEFQYNLASLTPTVCRLMNVDPPSLSNSRPIHSIVSNISTGNRLTNVDRCLIFCPDAIGLDLVEAHPEPFRKVMEDTGIRIPLCSVYPPKTPVCFASMFTGTEPPDHGITVYTRPVLKCDTLFDALLRAGKKVAIVAVRDSSIDLIFRERAMDYYSEDFDDQVTRRVIELLRDGRYDFIVAYQQEYDDTLHSISHDCPEAVRAMNNHVSAFDEITKAYHKYWNNYNRMIVFAPDHGAHFDEKTGRSDHGDNIPEDMRIVHFYGFNAATDNSENPGESK